MTGRVTGAMTLAAARVWVAENREDGVTCPCCWQLAKVYRRKVTSQVARALIAMYRDGGDADGWIHLPTLLARKGADEAKARYWYLIEPMPDVERADGSTRTGWWRLTETGRLYVEGTCTVPKFARIYDGVCLELEGPQVGIRDALGTRFDYDDLMAGR